MDWRLLSSAPKDGTPIFVCNRLYTQNGFLPICVRWRTYHPNAKGETCWRDVHGHKVDNITHWMKLPAPPLSIEEERSALKSMHLDLVEGNIEG